MTTNTRHIELYVRHTSWTGKTRLDFCVQPSMREALAEGIRTGHLDVDISLELSVLPEWFTDKDAMHARIPVSIINVHDTENSD